MILLVHLLLGALIGQKIGYPYLAIILAFLSHYFLDFIPHIEYKTNKGKISDKTKKDALKVFVDFICGITLIFLLSDNFLIVYICAFFGILPDAVSVLGEFVSNKFFTMAALLHRKIHFLENKKISSFWRIFSQVAVVVFCIMLFKL